jgi:hypothetical protein
MGAAEIEVSERQALLSDSRIRFELESIHSHILSVAKE